MRVWICLLVTALSMPAFAELPEAAAQQHFVLGTRWRELRQFQKAVGEFEQAYLLDGKPLHLYYMAQSYEQLASIPTNTASEVMANKMQALGLYETFIEKAPQGEPGLEMARARIELLRQDIKQLAAQVAEREASLRLLNDKMDQILTEIRGLREFVLRREHANIPATFVSLRR